MYTGSFIIHIKTEDFYKGIVNHVKNCFRHQLIAKIKKDHVQEV